MTRGTRDASFPLPGCPGVATAGGQHESRNDRAAQLVCDDGPGGGVRGVRVPVPRALIPGTRRRVTLREAAFVKSQATEGRSEVGDTKAFSLPGSSMAQRSGMIAP